jgi:hypothetical protein
VLLCFAKGGKSSCDSRLLVKFDSEKVLMPPKLSTEFLAKLGFAICTV